MTMLIITAVFVISFMTVGKVVGFLSPSSIFLIMQYVMAVGTFPLLREEVPADSRHKLLLISTYVAFAATSNLLALAEDSRRHSRRNRSRPGLIERNIVVITPNKVLISLLLFSLAVSLLYYQAVGYNLFVESLLGRTQGSNVDIAGLRLEAYAGERYLFPGYVNQFKNVLLPSLMALIAVWLVASRHTLRWPLIVTFTAVCVPLIMGTGQRGAMVTILLVLITYASYFGKKQLRRAVTLAALIGLPLFFLGSTILGRSASEMENASTWSDRLGVQFNEFMARIFESNQLASVAAFRYVESQEIQWGAEWLQSVVGLLPGVQGSSLAGEVFATIYGSSRGTAPPSVWTSLFYNFGTVGAIVGAIVLGIVYFMVSKTIHAASEINTLSAIGMAGVTVLMGTWIAGGPEYFFNAGIIVFIILWWAGKHLSPSHHFRIDTLRVKKSKKTKRRIKPHSLDKIS